MYSYVYNVCVYDVYVCNVKSTVITNKDKCNRRQQMTDKEASKQI